MFLMRSTGVALVLAAMLATVHGQHQSPADRPWPPAVQTASPDSPPLPPADALKTFFMPPGYRLELVASEPLIQEPVAIDWDLDGRLWAVEMPGFMADLTGSNELEPIGRVVVLEDTDGDGRMDKRTVFADRLVLARSLKVLDRGVLVAEPPNVWLMRDTDGDLRMDEKELVTNQYGRFEADPQNNANGFLWALDNRMYTAGQADIHLRPKGTTLGVEKTLQRGEWGITQDEAGRIYRNTNESALHVDLVPTAYFARHPGLLRTRGAYERLADEANGLNTVWPVRPNPGTNRAYQTGIDRADGTLAKFTSVCAPEVYRGDRLPADLRGNVFVAEPAANLVSRIVLDTSGPSVQARKAYERGEFIASTDERFRPVYLSSAPDGLLYVVDMYRGIIEHRISITMYLRDQILERKLDQGTGYGRIYRVVHETSRRDTTAHLRGASIARLVEALAHPNGWWRDTAQRLLVERGAVAAAPALRALAQESPDPVLRLRALWTLDGLDRVDTPLVTTALTDRSREVRAAAVRIAERWLGEKAHPIGRAVTGLIDDPDAAVRRQVAASIGGLPPAERTAAQVAMLGRHGDDPVTLDATLSGAGGTEAALLQGLLQAGGEATPQRDAAITMTAATIVRGGKEVDAVFGPLTNESREAWQRSALLAGAEVALLGARMPGTPAPRPPAATAAAAPCPTCPGGRAGPGGAYAFTKPVPTARGNRGAGPELRLTGEPAGLVALAAAGGDLGRRAERVLTRVTWTGKSGAVAAVPLTALEQQRFDAGREIYRNVCQACHQPDGRGQDKIAPALVGSAMALAPAGIAARVLLHGKEGATGLMPPIGAAFGDEQLAGVLTYIRREWGQTADAVDPATIKAVRAATRDRIRPWTDAELEALPEWTAR